MDPWAVLGPSRSQPKMKAEPYRSETRANENTKKNKQKKKIIHTNKPNQLHHTKNKLIIIIYAEVPFPIPMDSRKKEKHFPSIRFISISKKWYTCKKAKEILGANEFLFLFFIFIFFFELLVWSVLYTWLMALFFFSFFFRHILNHHKCIFKKCVRNKNEHAEVKRNRQSRTTEKGRHDFCFVLIYIFIYSQKWLNIHVFWWL